MNQFNSILLLVLIFCFFFCSHTVKNAIDVYCEQLTWFNEGLETFFYFSTQRECFKTWERGLKKHIKISKKVNEPATYHLWLWLLNGGPTLFSDRSLKMATITVLRPKIACDNFLTESEIQHDHLTVCLLLRPMSTDKPIKIQHEMAY